MRTRDECLVHEAGFAWLLLHELRRYGGPSGSGSYIPQGLPSQGEACALCLFARFPLVHLTRSPYVRHLEDATHEGVPAGQGLLSLDSLCTEEAFMIRTYESRLAGAELGSF